MGTESAPDRGMRTPHVPVFLCAWAALSACSTLPLPTPAPRPPGASGDAVVAAEVVDLTNRERLRHGLRPLGASSLLMEAARLHAEQMAAYRQAAHTITSARYPTMQSRLEAVRYSYASAAENVAWNQRSAAEVVATWMASSGHRANILDANLMEIGAAMARAANGEPYWIQVFGRPR